MTKFIPGSGIPLILVGATILLNLSSAVILKEAASTSSPTVFFVALVLMIVLVLNLLRVLVWSAIHRRYPLSNSYPLTSLFFPMIMLISLLYGEEIGWTQIAGTVLITSGIATLTSNTARQPNTSDWSGDR